MISYDLDELSLELPYYSEFSNTIAVRISYFDIFSTELVLIQSGRGDYSARYDMNYYVRDYADSGKVLICDVDHRGKKSFGPWFRSSNPQEAREIEYYHPFGIRPALYVGKLFPIITCKRIKNYCQSGMDAVEFGEYPQDVLDYSRRQILDENYQAGLVKKTGKKYTLGCRRSKDNIELVQFDEYEFAGKRYVRIKLDRRIKFSEKLSYSKGEFVWIEVVPIVWLINDDNKTLLSAKILLRGIPPFPPANEEFNYGSEGDKYVRPPCVYEDTYIHKFLQQYMLREMMPTFHMVNAKHFTILTHENLSKIDDVVAQIYAYINTYNVPGSEEIREKVVTIIQEHNDAISRMIQLKKENKPVSESLDVINHNTLIKLTHILDDLEWFIQNNKKYYSMINSIDVYISIINGEEVNINSDVATNLISIMTVYINSIKPEKRSKFIEELIAIFSNQKKEIMDYLFASLNNNTFEGLSYNSIPQMNLDLNKKISDLLKKYGLSVEKIDQMEYAKMVEAINKYISIVEGANVDMKGSLDDDLFTLVTICLPYLDSGNGEKTKNQLLSILNDQKKEILDATLIDNERILPYRSVKEMDLVIRKKIHPVLVELSRNVNSNYFASEVKNALRQIIDGCYISSNNKFLSYIFADISDNYMFIKNRIFSLPSPIYEKYRQELEAIIDRNINYDGGSNAIIKDLRRIMLDLRKLKDEIINYFTKVKQVKDSFIDLTEIKEGVIKK